MNLIDVPTRTHLLMRADCFSGPGKAVDLVCVCVCLFEQYYDLLRQLAAQLKEMNKTYTKKITAEYKEMNTHNCKYSHRPTHALTRKTINTLQNFRTT